MDVIPWTESPFFEDELASRPGLAAKDRELAAAYNRDGYVVIKGAIDPDRAQAVIGDLDPVFRADYGVRVNGRLQDGWRSFQSVGEIAVDQDLMRVIGMLYDRNPVPFQTLNFKHGTQQRGHADEIHFSCIPARFMCGAWAALEPTSADNGCLFYYPGSHKLPELHPHHMGMMAGEFSYQRYEDYQERVMEAAGLKPVEFHAELGDVLIWSSNIVHGGSTIMKPGSTRWSQVTHYYFDDCIYLTPMHSNMDLGEFALRDSIIDIATGRHMPQSYNGRRAWGSPAGATGRSRISL